MPSATVTSKGQITIPIAVRKALGLKPGTRVDFYEREPGKFAFMPRNRSIMELEGCVPRLDHTLTIEEMNEAILEQAAELDAATRSDGQPAIKDGEAA